ncbi:DUF4886 domain-containing protein [uncultured Roseibium sp.]|uniref:DUF4886 domain-containing protein n=1 Tax=uncultured Roseibium sp. TaxID=1936171 RepID=UPI0026166966|nr:DUF4886 domain-containing protein [uncultured Roseibium sp.]
MKKAFFCTLVGLASLLGPAIDVFASPPSPETSKILFVGNSLTLGNDLPGLVKSIAASKGVSIVTRTTAKGSARLEHHAENPQVKTLLDETAWDFVVLQEHSQLPALRDEDVAQKTLPYARWLAERARLMSPETEVVFYMAMAHRDGDQFNKKNFSKVGTYAGMQQRSNDTYNKMARQNGASVVPVGVVWSQMRTSHPDVNLYIDERHPTVAGSYLAACVFFTTLFSQGCEGAYQPMALADGTGLKIQNLSDDVLLRNAGIQ